VVSVYKGSNILQPGADKFKKCDIVHTNRPLEDFVTQKIGVEELLAFASKDLSEQEMEALCPFCEAIDSLPADQLLEQIQAEFDEPAQQFIAEGLTSGDLDRDILIVIMADAAKNKSSVS
jgi:hypothetical protein